MNEIIFFHKRFLDVCFFPQRVSLELLICGYVEQNKATSEIM